MPELHELSQVLTTPRDLIRWAASQFEERELCFGHGTDNALDEAAALVLQCLHLPVDTPAVYLEATLMADERSRVLQWVQKRMEQRLPLPYITGKTWFAGMEFKADERALIPRSPIAELIAEGFEPWLTQEPSRVLDLCTGGGCIAIALAHLFPHTPVDATDLSADALSLAAENVELHHLSQQMELLQGDLFAPCAGRTYDLIVSNPPYVGAVEVAALPEEFRHEPQNALLADDNGLALVHTMLAEAPKYLNDGGLFVCEVGASAAALAASRPNLDFTWVEFANGGDGVFILSKEQLMQESGHVG